MSQITWRTSMFSDLAKFDYKTFSCKEAFPNQLQEQCFNTFTPRVCMTDFLMMYFNWKETSDVAADPFKSLMLPNSFCCRYTTSFLWIKSWVLIRMHSHVTTTIKQYKRHFYAHGCGGNSLKKNVTDFMREVMMLTKFSPYPAFEKNELIRAKP